MRALACSFCGIAVSTGRPAARMDLDTVVCGDCATLEPDRAGSALRAGARLLGVAEDDPYFLEALREDPGGVDGLLYIDPGDPLRSRVRAPQREPWQHVPQATREALRRAQARGLDLRMRADRARTAPAEVGPPSGPPGCLLCGVGASASWRRVLTAALTPGPEHVEGHLCAACLVAYDRVGAVGPSLVERAWLHAAGVAWPPGCPPPAVRAWVSTGLPPSPTPWDHVGEVREPEPDLDPLLALQTAVRDLAAKVEVLEARLP